MKIFIPPEIISSIFSAGITEIIDADKYASDDAPACLVSAIGIHLLPPARPANLPRAKPQTILHFLIAVCHVCRDWRATAFNNPFLWSTIRFDRTISVTALSFWVARTSSHLLNITLHVNHTILYAHVHPGLRRVPRLNYVERDAQLMGALDILEACSQRWRSLTIAAKCTFDLMHIIHRIENIRAAPKLQLLELRGDYQRCGAMVPDEDITWYRQPKLFFQGSHPLLSDVRLYCVPTSWCQGSHASSVHVFCLESKSPDHVQGDESLDIMLKQAGMLHTLSVTAKRSYVFSEGVHLPFLTRLDVAFTNAEFALDLLSAIHSTKLQVLSLSLADDDFSSVLDQLSERSPAVNMLGSVEELIVKNLNANALSMDEFLRQLVSVQRVTVITTSAGPRTFYKRLLSNALLILSPDFPLEDDVIGVPLFCPKLSTFFSCGLTGAELVELVAARQKTGHPLGEVHMTIDDFIQPEDRSWLSAHVPQFSSHRCLCTEPWRHQAIQD